MARFTPTGDLDTGFNGTGTLTIAAPGALTGIAHQGVAIAPDGKIAVASEGFSGSGGAFVVTR